MPRTSNPAITKEDSIMSLNRANLMIYLTNTRRAIDEIADVQA
jgi:hypothetical protein